jgi:hypothetical protein
MNSSEKRNQSTEVFSRKEREEILINIFQKKEIDAAFLYK